MHLLLLAGIEGRESLDEVVAAIHGRIAVAWNHVRDAIAAAVIVALLLKDAVAIVITVIVAVANRRIVRTRVIGNVHLGMSRSHRSRNEVVRV